VYQIKEDWMAANVARMLESKGSYCDSVEKSEKKDHLEESGVYG
jgi:hypothetical protein